MELESKNISSQSEVMAQSKGGQIYFYALNFSGAQFYFHARSGTQKIRHRKSVCTRKN